VVATVTFAPSNFCQFFERHGRACPGHPTLDKMVI
jgi:hypothetical protein